MFTSNYDILHELRLLLKTDLLQVSVQSSSFYCQFVGLEPLACIKMAAVSPQMSRVGTPPSRAGDVISSLRSSDWAVLTYCQAGSPFIL